MTKVEAAETVKDETGNKNYNKVLWRNYREI